MKSFPVPFSDWGFLSYRLRNSFKQAIQQSWTQQARQKCVFDFTEFLCVRDLCVPKLLVHYRKTTLEGSSYHCCWLGISALGWSWCADTGKMPLHRPLPKSVLWSSLSLTPRRCTLSYITKLLFMTRHSRALLGMLRGRRRKKLRWHTWGQPFLRNHLCLCGVASLPRKQHRVQEIIET